ncbi:MAG: porin family protein [Bacteroidia bacterium]|nr:porin family protein [Bacteroidia bacterium]
MNIFKKIIFVTSLLIVVSNISSAQELGIRGGFNLAKISYKAGDKVIHPHGYKYNPGFNVGPIIELPLKSLFSLESGVLFTLKGLKESYSSNNYLNKINLFYAEMPVLFKLSYPIGKTSVFLAAGGYVATGLFGYYVGAADVNSVRVQTHENVHWGNSENTTKRLDYGLKFGAGLKIKVFQLGTSYGYGLLDIMNDRSLKYRNRVLEFYVIYKVKSFKK